MKENIIKNYIDKLSISDIKRFSINNNIDLNNDELNIIYRCVKNDWKTIIYGNYNNILNDLKSKINKDNYNKIEKLFMKYKSKYQNLL